MAVAGRRDDRTDVGHRADRHDPRRQCSPSGGNPCGPQHLVVYRAVSALGRQLSTAIRAFPELVLGGFSSQHTGPGRRQGPLALGVHSIGMLAKLYADIMENVDPGAAEAAGTAAGAGKLQVFCCHPAQVLP